MYDFLVDLDDFFCEKYANYDKLCGLKGYKMPKMQATRIDEFGRSFAYTLPSETLRLALQEDKEALLADLKTKLLDKTFSFSFRPVGLFRRIKNSFSKLAPYKILKVLLARHGVSEKEAGDTLSISEEVWEGVYKGKFTPTKNLIFSLALACHFTVEDVDGLFLACGEAWDFTSPKDVVVSYLLQTKIYGEDMIKAALEEYKIRNLFMQ